MPSTIYFDSLLSDSEYWLYTSTTNDGYDCGIYSSQCVCSPGGGIYQILKLVIWAVGRSITVPAGMLGPAISICELMWWTGWLELAQSTQGQCPCKYKAALSADDTGSKPLCWPDRQLLSLEILVVQREKTWMKGQDCVRQKICPRLHTHVVAQPVVTSGGLCPCTSVCMYVEKEKRIL